MRVVVLMSTYQGERWVTEQIHSILCQLPPEGRVLVRDDGSRDSTVERIAAIRDPRISLERGANMGFVRSFLSLLASAPADSEMIMLADQDDFWLPNKIERAWSVIGNSAGFPTLYCSRLRLVDEQLKPLGLSPNWPREPSFENALTENIVTGCTIALSPSAALLARNAGDPDRIYFHDWWLYLLVSAFGRVVFDSEPTILYRQHSGNAIGMGSGLGRYWTILRFLRKRNWVHIMFNQIENLRSLHGADLPPRHQALLSKMFNPHDPAAIMRLLCVPRRVRQTLVSDFLFRGILAFDLLAGRGLLPRAVANSGG
jgi:glycosyltransferase involved in cell wall biosynthesis